MNYIFLHASEGGILGHCDTWWWWSILAFALGALLHWLLWGRGQKEDCSQIEAERDRYHKSATKWETDYQSVKYQLEESQKAEADLRSALGRCEADKASMAAVAASGAAAIAVPTSGKKAGKGTGAAFGVAAIPDAASGKKAGKGADSASGAAATPDAASGKKSGKGAGATSGAAATPDAASGKKAGKGAGTTSGAAAIPVPIPVNTDRMGIASGTGGEGGDGSIYAGLFDNDNFQIIEGVGPKVNSVLINAGYKTWSDLAAADSGDIRKHLDEAGKRFGLCDPTSWPHQAKLADAGDWDELIRYQKFTDGGRETVGDFKTDSKFEKLSAKKLGFSSSNPNDLKVVEGIGPKIDGLLKAGGINNWSELAAADVARIQEILDAAGPRYKLAVPRTWPQQAGLAAAGDWSGLKSLQAELNAGK